MTATKRFRAGAIAAATLAVAAALAACQPAEAPGAHPAPGGPGGAPAASAAPAAGTPAHAGKAAARKSGDKPLWRTLTPAQQAALQPLQGEWDAMDGLRKQKWLDLANRFAGMQPEERERVQQRMRAWVSLTPEQRELARETYNRTRKIAPDQKTATWESYQQLPDEQKRQLAASSAAHKAPPVVPSQAGGKAVVPLGQGALACPAGSVRNTVSATPPCVPAPAPSASPTPPAQPAPAQPAPSQDKPVPANWGITPNDA